MYTLHWLTTPDCVQVNKQFVDKMSAYTELQQLLDSGYVAWVFESAEVIE